MNNFFRFASFVSQLFLWGFLLGIVYQHFLLVDEVKRTEIETRRFLTPIFAEERYIPIKMAEYHQDDVPYKIYLPIYIAESEQELVLNQLRTYIAEEKLRVK